MNIINLIKIYTRHIITYNFYPFILNLIFNSTCVIEIVIEHLIQLQNKSDVDLKTPRNVAQDLCQTVMTIAVGSITEQDTNAVVYPEITYREHILKLKQICFLKKSLSLKIIFAKN